MEMTVGELYSDVCDATTCFIKATAVGYKDISSSIRAENLYNSYLYLSPMKDAKLVQNPQISTNNFVQINEKTIRFNVKVSENSPFLFMELKDSTTTEPFKVYGSNAGWFSDNNFLAEKGQTYTIDYESFSSEITVEEFKARFTARVLQSIYTESDFLKVETTNYDAFAF